MKRALYYVLFIVLLGFGDCICYGYAPYPDRASHWYSYMPGSGYIAIIRKVAR